MKGMLPIALLLLGGTSLALEPLLVTGAGATFPYPLYCKWFSEYDKLHPDIAFRYRSIGSGGGIQQITNGNVDFAASDAPMTDDEISKVPDVVHIPTVLGAVVVIYTAPFKGLKLTPDLLAAIFLGKVQKWNEPAVAAVNTGTKLPDLEIKVVHRLDGSGTTAIFTDYLAKISREWKDQVGAGKTVKWPTGIGGKGNEGVTGLVKQTPGAIGYVELTYANQSRLAIASLRNHEGQFVNPTPESTSEAAAGAQIPADYRVSITDAPGHTAYPMASFTYILVRRNMKGGSKREAINRFLWWAVHEGQTYAAPLDYAPLPTSVVARIENTIHALTMRDRPPDARSCASHFAAVEPSLRQSDGDDRVRVAQDVLSGGTDPGPALLIISSAAPGQARRCGP